MAMRALALACLGCVVYANRVNRRQNKAHDTAASLASLLISPHSVTLSRSRISSQALARGGRPLASVSEWSELEHSLPSLAGNPCRVFLESALKSGDLEGKTVLFRDKNGWCPYSERVWLALEVKKVDYMTCLVEDDYSSIPGEKGSLPRVRWPDGTTNDGSDITTILERIQDEHPGTPHFFPAVSASVAVVKRSFNRFDGIMPRFTLPSSTAPYVFACRLQRAGSFEVEECEIGELVPKFKYDVFLEEIEEMLEEYDDGPFIAGSDITAADIYWAPFLERLAAYLPALYDKFLVRGGSLDAVNAWYDAMDELVPCYSCRVKGRVALWQKLLAKEPYLEGKLQKEVASVPDLPSKKSFDANKVWAAYAGGQSHLEATPSKEAAASIVRNRAVIIAGAKSCNLGVDDIDGALRELCAALVSNQTALKLSADAQVMASYLIAGCEGMSVPQDLGVIPFEALREIWNRGID